MTTHATTLQHLLAAAVVLAALIMTAAPSHAGHERHHVAHATKRVVKAAASPLSWLFGEPVRQTRRCRR